MRWQDREGSDNVEDRRNAGGGGRGGLAIGGGIGGLVILLVVAFLSGDPIKFLQQQAQQQGNMVPGPDPGPRRAPPAQEDELVRFVSVVLRDTEVVWTGLFREQGRRYRKPKLVLFADRVDSACGLADAAVGPFYCPGDEKVYLDLTFYEEMRTRFRAPGDFAQAYVIAHEIGHHVQHQLGISDRVHAQRRQLSKADYNRLSVRLELQADYFAGVWAHHAEKIWKILEPGDIEEALRCASAIGDDRLQRQAQGYVVPDSFTHGTSAQRMKWFRRGLQSGDMTQGDTFSARDL